MYSAKAQGLACFIAVAKDLCETVIDVFRFTLLLLDKFFGYEYMCISFFSTRLFIQFISYFVFKRSCRACLLGLILGGACLLNPIILNLGQQIFSP